MNLQELRKLVRKGEGQTLEFKLKANHPDKIVKEMVAFANTDGGLLLIGVHDDKTIEGVKSPDEDEYIIMRAVERYTAPPVEYEVERIGLAQDSEREVLAFYIPKRENTHHVFIEYEPKKQFKTYIRWGDRSIQASKEMKEVLRGRAKQHSVRFHFGDKERVLMQYLSQNQDISVTKFAKIANIPLRIASRTLVLLVLAQVLAIIPNHQHEDSFQMVEKFN